ncbi:MAG: M1 family metallopeptidase [Hyphomonadaceae bacterium]
MTHFKTALFGCAALVFGLAACGAPADGPQPETHTQASGAAAASETTRAFTADKFTQSNYRDVRVTHLDLDLDVDFDAKVLRGTARLDFERIDANATELVLDTKGLTILNIAFPDGDPSEPVAFEFDGASPDPVLGAKLSIPLLPNVSSVLISYETSPDAEGLQWLSPEQTAGKTQPYLFSQAQALNARTMAPVQDTPAVRMTYSAKLRVPDGILPLMSAEQSGRDTDGAYTFNMPQPVPSYLLAIAAGDIKFKAINDHIGVYAEEYILDASVEEFAETPDMEAANEALYGPYRWGRYDLIVLPPSFPFGGMENPRLSFMTPTLIAGDKSLTNVVAHELAHSWSGNLVTNSNWRDSWLNEGFTSYVENRVMEALYGERRAVMEQALALEDLKRDLAELDPALTQLKLNEDLAHPDDAFTQVAYVKGQFFLMFLEERFGREKFDPFLKAYFNDFAFDSITTEDFVTYLHEHLHADNPDALTRAELDEWIYGQGLPATAKVPVSDAFATVDTARSNWAEGTVAAADVQTGEWSTHEWLHFVNGLPDGLSGDQYAALDGAFSFTGTQNAETAFAWYMQTIRGGYEPADPALEGFLLSVGRGKFIYRLYGALQENGKGDWARDVYERARPGYHPIAQRRIDAILGESE